MNRRRFLARTAHGIAAAALAPEKLRSLASAQEQNATAPNVAAKIETGVSPFPKDFRWGVSTSAYQVEGAWNEGGKGESVWDHFAHTPSMIKGAATGDVACDSYHRYADDLQLMKQMNIRSYRFSVSWPRVLPAGRGAINPKGLDYYDRLTDAILAQGIRPVCTLFHWDLPQTLADPAWRSRETVKLFGEYASIVAKTLGDRIKTWAILNEPTVFARGGYGLPLDAPEKTSFSASLRSQHGANLATGEAFRALKAAHSDARVGNALAMSPVDPETDSAADRAAAERYHAWLNLWFLQPSLQGTYPDAFVGAQPLEEMGFEPGDEEKMQAPLDWIGINYYNRVMARARPVTAESKAEARLGVSPSRGYQGPLTLKGWEVWPQGIYDIVTRIAKNYDLPIEITENGCSCNDAVEAHDRVPDPQRIEFYRAHFNQLARAMTDGAKVQGFHAWSLLDNFEWIDAYSQRFGLVFVDREDLRRIVKDSGHWYAKVIAESRA